MPSPFPGMDPYLEDQHLWAGFHNALASEISKSLNRDLPAPYWSQMEMRSEIGIGEERPQEVVADVSVHRPAATSPVQTSSATSRETSAVLDAPRTELSTTRRVRFSVEPWRLASIEVRDPRDGRRLVTMIEILSPSNKRRGPDRTAYLRKRRRLLSGNVSLVEIDLLRKGRRPWSDEPGLVDLNRLAQPIDYLVAVNRAWDRGGEYLFDFFPVAVTEKLPVIPVPLRENELEVPLDLQFCFQQAWDGGPYRRGAIDYDRPPPVALADDLEAWRAGCLAGWRSH